MSRDDAVVNGDPTRPRRELGLAAKFCGVSLIGFLTDAGVLHLALRLGLEPAWGRVISLACAMHVTFLINGCYVFRCLEPARWPGQWAGYMAAGAFGAACNYWIFVTLVSTHWRLVSSPIVALSAGSMTACGLNYLAGRLLVFRRAFPRVRS